MEGTEGTDEPVSGIPILGDGTNDIGTLVMEEVASSADGISGVTDVKVHPDFPGEIWVTSQNNDAVVIVFDAGTDERTSKFNSAPGANHFLAKPMGIAFGEGTMASTHEEDQPTQGAATPADFMGPTLWDSNAVNFDGGHPTHLDMLHNSPNSTGIAWDSANIYWVFDGAHNSITRYDFRNDHGYGGADHSDGVTSRYVEGEVKYVSGVASHMEIDHETGMLYVADTGNNRVAVLDTASGERGGAVFPNYDGVDQHAMTGASLETVVDGEDNYMGRPAGLALHDGKIFVSDHQTGEIQAFDLEGNFLDFLQTDLGDGALGGIDFDDEGRMYLVDRNEDRVLRLSVK
jgi:DNA-binding beta-propeller fold protein YncE